MTSSATENDVRSLQRRAEQAIRAAKPREQIVRLLEQLVQTAPAESDAARFAHRHLAEMRLEESPWRAALHLRRVIAQDADDDVAHALMGLSQALQANFRCAVSSYRRAVALSPTNPWYNHNLGHLLDVALNAPRDAMPYLKRAYKLEPSQAEVAASLAHCLGRVGHRDEALEIARGLVKRAPRDTNHQTLLRWIEQGASASKDATVPGLLAATPPASTGSRTAGAPAAAGTERRGVSLETVERLLAEEFARLGWHGPDVTRARAMLHDYATIARPLAGQAAILAATIDYALARVDGSTVKQKDVAGRYGIAPGALQNRYASLRAVLRLQPHDARYARAAGHKREDEKS